MKLLATSSIYNTNAPLKGFAGQEVCENFMEFGEWTHIEPIRMKDNLTLTFYCVQSLSKLLDFFVV